MRIAVVVEERLKRVEFFLTIIDPFLLRREARSSGRVGRESPALSTNLGVSH